MLPSKRARWAGHAVAEVEGLQAAVQPSGAILRGKLHGRGYGTPSRDLLDIAVAAEAEPEAVETAVNTLSAAELDARTRALGEWRPPADETPARSAEALVHDHWRHLWKDARQRARAAMQAATRYTGAHVVGGPVLFAPSVLLAAVPGRRSTAGCRGLAGSRRRCRSGRCRGAVCAVVPANRRRDPRAAPVVQFGCRQPVFDGGGVQKPGLPHLAVVPQVLLAARDVLGDGDVVGLNAPARGPIGVGVPDSREPALPFGRQRGGAGTDAVGVVAERRVEARLPPPACR